MEDTSTKEAQPYSLQPTWTKFEKFWLYETRTLFYLIGLNEAETQFRLLKIYRTIEHPDKLSDILREDSLTYSAQEIADVLDMISEGNRAYGGLIKICTAYGIVGFVKFLNGYYLTLITARKEVGCIAGNIIYSIKATEMFAIKPRDEPESNALKAMWKKLNKKLSQTNLEIAESRYVGLFQFVDMTKDFFFSYTYDLSHSLQFNYLTSKNEAIAMTQEMFEWNYYQINDFRTILGSEAAMLWTMPIIHGSYQQRRFSTFGRTIDLVLLARRSRHYAGTRYLKRGLSVSGKVANDCEVEQIVQYDAGMEWKFSSYLQMRGSIPTYWYQETSVTMPKPPILINRVDPDYLATQEHFADMFRRYSSPVIVLDLVKQHEKRARESLVGREFRNSIEVLNESIPNQHKIRYLALDYSRITSISKGKFTKVKVQKKGGFLTYSSNSENSSGKGKAMQAVGEEWAMMEKSLKTDSKPTFDRSASQSSAYGRDNSNITHNAESVKMTNFDDAKKDFSTVNKQQSNHTNPTTSETVANIDNIADFHAVESRIDVLKELEDIANLTLHETGFFCNSLQFLSRVTPVISASHIVISDLQTTTDNKYQKHAPQQGMIVQHGVLRTNCIDCLDRTNGGQFAVAMRFLLLSMQALGITNTKAQAIDVSKDPILLSLMEMYGEMGDKIALQYGGSEAHKKVLAGKSVKQVKSSKQSELLTSIKRYYSNAFTDMVKQDAMNLFLGCFVPAESAIPLWDLESDYNLHNLTLRPPSSPVYRVLYEDLLQDGLRCREMKIRSKLELSIKKALLEAAGIKQPGSSAGSGSVAAAGTPVVAADDEEGPAGASSNSVGLPAAAGNVHVEWNQLLRKYHVKHLLITTTGGGAAAVDSAAGNSTTVSIRMKNKNMLAQTIKAMARLERRKFLRIVAAKKIATSAELWWVSALTEYDLMLKGVFHCVQLPPGSTDGLVEDNYNRVYKPEMLTEFDELLALDFFDPIETAGERAIQRSQLAGDNRKSTLTVIEEADEDVVDGGGRADSNDLTSPPLNSLTSLFSFYPSLLPSNNNNSAGGGLTANNLAANATDNTHSNTNNDNSVTSPGAGALQRKLTTGSAVTNDDDNAASNTAANAGGGFQFGKYVREIGKAARTLVGGFYKKDEQHGNMTANDRKVNRMLNFEQDDRYRRLNSQICLLHHYIPKGSMLQYRRYVDIFENNLILLDEDRKQFKKLRVLEEEYGGLLRDCLVGVDDVKAMEALAQDAYINELIQRGVYEGLPQGYSAREAYLFLYTAMTNIECDLQDFGVTVDRKAQISRNAAVVSVMDSTKDIPINLSSPPFVRSASGGAAMLHGGSPSSPVTPSNSAKDAASQSAEPVVLNAPSPVNAQDSITSFPAVTSAMTPMNAQQQINHLVSLRSTSLEMTNQLQDKLTRFILQFNISHGLEAELKKCVNNYIFQQYTYSKEISSERLSRRVSPFTSEKTILDYSSQFDHDILASSLPDMHYIASANPNYSSFRDLFALQGLLDHKEKVIAGKKAKVLQELQQLLSPAAGNESEAASSNSRNKVVSSATSSSSADNGDSASLQDVSVKLDEASSKKDMTSISAQLGLHIDGLMDDLTNMADYSLDYFGTKSYPVYPYTDESTSYQPAIQFADKFVDEHGHALPNDPFYESIAKTSDSNLQISINHEYAGFNHLAPDLYARSTNPHLQLNEIGVVRFQESLKITKRH